MGKTITVISVILKIKRHVRPGVLRVLTARECRLLPRGEAELAAYDVVITTFNVLSLEWGRANPAIGSQRFFERNSFGKRHLSWRLRPGGSDTAPPDEPADDPDEESSPLLRVAWKRVVLDEGHVMGADETSNKAMMCAGIQCRSRWICTGTPAPSTPSSELMHLQGLMGFLCQSPFSSSAVWRCAVVAPFERGQEHAWCRLYSLLERVMIRSAKDRMEAIGTIPVCIRRETRVEMSNGERRAYNGLISIIKRNIILAEGKGSKVDSLLHKQNVKYAREALKNCRKACCVTGQHTISVVRAHVDECLHDMRRGHRLLDKRCQCNGVAFDVDKSATRTITDRSGDCPLLLGDSMRVPEDRVKAVERAFIGEGQSGGDTVKIDAEHSRCQMPGCRKRALFPFITPCGHIICLSCLDLDPSTLTLCSRAPPPPPPPSSSSPQGSSSPPSSQPPHDAEPPPPPAPNASDAEVKELCACGVCGAMWSFGHFASFQPSVENASMRWSESWVDTVSTKVAVLMNRLRGLGFFRGKDSSLLPVDEVKWQSHVVSALDRMPKELALAKERRVADPCQGGGTKCIVYSNFIEAIDVVCNTMGALLNAEEDSTCWMRCTSNLKGGNAERAGAIENFREDPKVTVLMMDGVGSLGLDLSFVSHIFLLDPIWDRSVEDQVIARAHRLGAQRAVTVEKFICEGTVEQLMEAMVTSQEGGRGGGGEGGRQRDEEEKRTADLSKLHTILKTMSLLTTDDDDIVSTPPPQKKVSESFEMLHVAPGEPDAAGGLGAHAGGQGPAGAPESGRKSLAMVPDSVGMLELEAQELDRRRRLEHQQGVGEGGGGGRKRVRFG